ncbi:NAD/NADP-dependent octopine/nopaline dehydrogenase family protein [Salinicoccus roseus]|uniref:NAD/NADP octopine/nopaline dehydrogenase family protein n=1 Tax=Salinicoccus roseus TaxID=45670 RepID=UPI00158465FE
MKVSIVGAGNGGVVAAADLTARGHEVTLYHSLQALKDPHEDIMQGKVNFKGEALYFHKFTQDPFEAVKDAEVIMTCLPTHILAQMFEELIPYLEDGQMVFINGASAMNSMMLTNLLKEKRPEVSVLIGESMSLTYAARYDYEENDADIILRSRHNLFSAYPSSDTEKMMEKLGVLYDTLVPAANIIETALNNGNPESHPAPSILNTGFIDNHGEEFYLYRDGVTHHTVKVIEAIDEERQKICEALEFEALDKSARSERSTYFEPGKPLKEQYNESPVLKDLAGPVTLNNRYVVEDVGYGLVLWKSIAEAVDVETPSIDSIIHLTSLMLEVDFTREGLTLEKIGLDGTKDLNAQV